MLTSLLTQLLGKVAEAMLTHAKACNLPLRKFFSQLCWCMCFGGEHWLIHLGLMWVSCLTSVGETRWSNKHHRSKMGVQLCISITFSCHHNLVSPLPSPLGLGILLAG